MNELNYNTHVKYPSINFEEMYHVRPVRSMSLLQSVMAIK